MKFKPSLFRSAAGVALVSLMGGCPFEPRIVSMAQEAGSLVIELETVAPAFYETCTGTPIVQLSREQSGETSLLRPYHEDVGNPFVGYYVDGSFHYPWFHGGCDAVMCIPMTSSLSIPLMHHVQVGLEGPPGDYGSYVEENGGLWMQPPEDFPVLESEIVSGPIEITVQYYTDSNCSGPLSRTSVPFDAAP